MKILYCNRNPNLSAETEFNAQRVSFEELLEQSDVISVHTGLTNETKGKFDLNAFEKMKRNAIFINTARGAIHNQHHLTYAVENKLIWGAGLDVTDPEPMDKNDRLLQLPTVAVLPHIGSATKEARDAMSVMAAKNIIAGLQGATLPYCVNPEVYDSNSKSGGLHPSF